MNNIKEYRKKKGYTQKEIADTLKIKQASYSDKERGRRGFTVEELLQLEDILGVSISDMFKDLKESLKKK